MKKCILHIASSMYKKPLNHINKYNSPNAVSKVFGMKNIYIRVYVCSYVYVCKSERMHACIYVHMYVRMYA